MASSRTQRGILAIIGATACFSVNDTLVKVVALRYPLGEVLFVRGLIVIVLAGAVAIAFGHTRSLWQAAKPGVALRSVLEGAAALVFTLGLLHTAIADLSALALASPILITIMSIVLFGEDVRWRRWTAILVGFAGVVLLAKPVPSLFNAWALMGLATAFISACRDVLTRQLDPRIPTIVISFSAAVGVTLAGYLLGLGETWRAMNANTLALTACSAVLVALGNYLIVLAFRGVEMSVVAPFRYTLLVWAGIAGYVAFGEVPDAFSIAGGILIVGSGVYMLHREAVRRREQLARAAADPRSAA